MNNSHAHELADTKIDVKVVLSGLWVSMLMVFAYVDIFGFFRADMIKGSLAAKLPNTGFAINQTFLMLTTLYILIPSLMVAVTLLVPARINRIANIAVGVIYTATIVPSAANEPWKYFVFGSIVEIILLLAIIRVSWKWPRKA
jgi:Family of unknown function (DUF6326)